MVAARGHHLNLKIVVVVVREPRPYLKIVALVVWEHRLDLKCLVELRRYAVST